MFDWFQTLSVFEQLCVLGTAIGAIAGAVQWMTSINNKMANIQTSTAATTEHTKATSRKLDTLTEKMDGHIEDLRSDVTDLQIRMVRVEGQIDTERE